MAHQIDTSTGRAAIAYANETPWHGLGTSMQPGMSIDDWREAAGLNWQVNRAPVQYENGELHTFTGRNVLYRTDTGDALSIVSDEYREVQPAEVLDFFRAITEAGGFQMETAGALSGGKRIWALAKVNDGAEIVGQDTVRPYLLLATSYDGTMATTAKFTAIRVVCNNTISLAVQQAGSRISQAETDTMDGPVVQCVKVMHRDTFNADKVRQQLGVVASQWDRFVINARLLADKKLTADEVDGMTFDLIAPSVRSRPGMPLRDPRESRGYKRIMSLFQGEAKGSDMVGTGSAWAWLNAVTQFVDWERGFTPDTRMNGAWFGQGDAVKTKAMEMALAA